MEISLAFQEHPDDDMWEQYALGHLKVGHSACLETHLLVCERCQNTLARTDEYVKLMKFATARFTERRAETRRSKVLPFVAGGRAAKVASAGVIAAASVLALLWITPWGRVHGPDSGAAAARVALQSLRGGAAMNRAPARHPLDFSIAPGDAPPSGRCRVEVVTSRGDTVWSGTADASGGALEIHLGRALSQGSYWVRLYGPSAELLAEYGLRVD